MKVLFIGIQNVFGNIRNGGSQCSCRNFDLVSSLAGKDNIYTAIIWNSEKNDRQCRYFRRTFNNWEAFLASICKCRFYMPAEEKKILTYVKEVNPDIIFLDTSFLGKIIKKVDKKTIVFFHNVEADYMWNKVKKEGMGYLPAYWATKYNEKCAMLADRVICLNHRDSMRMKQLYGRKADFLLPITFKDNFDKNKTVSGYKREILFLGSLFPPNENSVEWFIKEVVPKLDKVTLNIVGKDFEKRREEYEQNRNVRVIGTVDDTAIYYYNHAAVVLPIQYGAGMKVKTAEAMMYGRRIFASDEALEGYEIDGVKGISRCNTAQEYINAINTYFAQEEQKAYEEEVRILFLKNYETKAVQERFSEMIDKLDNPAEESS